MEVIVKYEILGAHGHTCKSGLAKSRDGTLYYFLEGRRNWSPAAMCQPYNLLNGDTVPVPASQVDGAFALARQHKKEEKTQCYKAAVAMQKMARPDMFVKGNPGAMRAIAALI